MTAAWSGRVSQMTPILIDGTDRLGMRFPIGSDEGEAARIH
jgi:hypothetical protein